MVTDSGVHISLHSGVHASFPPLYEKSVCNFFQVNYDQIKRAVNLFDWESALIDLDVNE